MLPVRSSTRFPANKVSTATLPRFRQTSPAGVKLVAKFFHGRQWGMTMPASAETLTPEGFSAPVFGSSKLGPPVGGFP